MVYYQRYGTNKYGAKKSVYNGRKYDSKFEAGVSKEIDILVNTGMATVEYQKTFQLYGKNGSKICSIRPDFILTFKDGHQEIWEAKGMETREYQIKRNLFVDNYPEYEYHVIKQKNNYNFSKRRK